LTKYKSVAVGKYRSKLEKFCAKELTDNKIKFKYEEWKVELIPKFISSIISYEKTAKGYVPISPNIRSITYTPDFVGDNWIIETKGQETSDFKIKWKMFKKYIDDNSLNYTLYKPTNQKQIKETIKLIKDEQHIRTTDHKN
jgi:hypothetical protein